MSNLLNRRYWIPRHVGIKGNEKSDSLAKSALNMAPDRVKILYADLKPKINKFFYSNNIGMIKYTINSY